MASPHQVVDSRTGSRRVAEHFGRVAAGYRQSSQSLRWRWLRQRETAAVAELMGCLDGQRVVDLGAGAGCYTDLALDLGASSVFAVDLVGDMLDAITDPRVTKRVDDATGVDFPWPVETVIAAGVLEFVDNPQMVFANARRQIAPGGRLIALMPPDTLLARIYKAYHARNGLDVHLFSMKRCQDMAAAAGWRIAETRFVWPYTRIMRLEPLDS